MSVLRANCPSCEATFKIANLALAGKTVKCPKCVKPFTLPELDDETNERPRTQINQLHKNTEDLDARPRKVKADRRDDEDDRRSRRRRENNGAFEERSRKTKTRRGDDEEDDRRDEDENERPRRRATKRTAKEKHSPVLLISIVVGILVLVGTVTAYLLLRDSTLRGEPETMELVKALTAAADEKDANKKMDAQMKALAAMMAIEQLRLSPDEQRKLDAKYKSNIDGLRARLANKPAEKTGDVVQRQPPDKNEDLGKEAKKSRRNVGVAAPNSQDAEFAAESKISPETVSAWRQANLLPDWHGQNEYGRYTTAGTTPNKRLGLSDVLPYFGNTMFRSTQALADLPSPDVPFVAAVTKASQNQLVGLSKHKSLVRLVLNDGELSDAVAKEFKDLPNLTNLGLYDMRLGAAVLSEIGSLKQLQVLIFGGFKPAPVDDNGLKKLSGLSNLVELSLHEAKVTDAGLNEITKLKNLEVLNLDGTKVTDAGMQLLNQLPNLKTLVLDRTSISDAGIKQLKGCQRLEQVRLLATRATEKSLDDFKELKGLTHLWINTITLTPQVIAKFKAFPNLKYLNLFGVPVNANSAEFKQLQAALPNCKIVLF
jgi:predicted Zn finger-like uncharacterized protein